MSRRKADVPSWFFQQSSVIPWRRRHGRIEVLLITTAKNRRWIFPKGVIDPGFSARAAARKEAAEEAGIQGVVADEPLGEYTYEKWNGRCRVQVYSMEVTTVSDTWEEMHLRRRRWTTVDEALGLIDRKELRRMLKRFAAET